MSYTKGKWHWSEFHGSAEDVALMKKHGMKPVQALTNDGQRYLMSGSGDDAKRIALVDCHTKYKRGTGHQQSCEERDANAHLIAAAPDMYEALTHLAAVVETHGWNSLAKDAPEYVWLTAARAALAKALGQA